MTATRSGCLGEPWVTALSGHTGLYWTVTGLVVVLGAATVTAGAVPVWRRFGPTQAGHATRHDIRRELSLSAARQAAQWNPTQSLPSSAEPGAAGGDRRPLHAVRTAR